MNAIMIQLLLYYDERKNESSLWNIINWKYGK